MFLFTYSFFIALYILGTSALIQKDETGSDLLPTPTVEENKNELFLPVDKDWQIEMCNKLNFVWNETCIQEKPELFRSFPKKIVDIRKDGNCFFSSLSYWISGTTKYGQILRKNIIDFAKTSEIYKTMTCDDERDARIRRMYRSVEFAESPEIFAAADYLKTSICVYSKSPFLKGWHFFAANNLLNTKEDEKCLYIINHGEHYDVVVDTYPIETDVLEENFKLEHRTILHPYYSSLSDDGKIIDSPNYYSTEDSILSAFKNPMRIGGLGENNEYRDYLLNAYKNKMDTDTDSLLSAFQDFKGRSKNPMGSGVLSENIKYRNNVTNQRRKIVHPYNNSLSDDGKIIDFDFHTRKNQMITNTFGQWNNIKSCENITKLFPVNQEWQMEKISLLEINLNDTEIDMQNICTKDKLNYSNLDLNVIKILSNVHCFFKALSLCITGSVTHFRRIKSKLISFLNESEVYDNFYNSFTKINRIDYFLIRVFPVGVAELYAAAEMLKTSIYIYSKNKWYFISKDGIEGKITNEQCLYLENPNENRFNVIVHD
ncbi:uncharacterized protein LOC126895262 isoform X1 [Daktulosphaira vitifoliae]|uniref:uncharacterized protein LOC126895262 isoform X1 n=1 Tax=Daktulosphaira vitifoliae TaxID=58002 RepID=UPI0021AA70CA|nr:uncharacterized protein LOC126895262 isoform X1 [Daktulosphaira vitifoliae]